MTDVLVNFPASFSIAVAAYRGPESQAELAVPAAVTWYVRPAAPWLLSAPRFQGIASSESRQDPGLHGLG